MASSPIEIASAPYHDVLRAHDRRMRDRDRDCSSKKRFVVKKNINELVRDHLHTCWGENAENSGGGGGGSSFGLVGRAGDGSIRREDEADSEAIRRRQTRILDRWAAHQAKEMISTIERQTHEAELLALSNSQSVSERASTFLRENSPSPSDSSVEVPNLRASSLVQMWKEFEAEATTPRGCQAGCQNANSNARYKRLNSTVSNVENASVCESPVGSERDFRFDTVEAPEDSFMEWDSEQIASTEQHLNSFQRQCSDASEGSKVANIVKRLTSASKTTSLSSCNENDPDHPVIACEPTSSVDHNPFRQEEPPREFKLNRKRLRLRGRQATKDWFMQLEHERHLELNRLAERHFVSNFPQRGRIQALVRLKFLQREAVAQNQQRPSSTSSELNQLHGRSTIFRLREKFNTRGKHIDTSDVPIPNEDRLQKCAQSQNVTRDSGNQEARNEDNLETHTRSLNAALDSCEVPIVSEDRFQTHAQLLSATKDTGLFDHLTSQDSHPNDITTIKDDQRTVELDQSTSSHDGQKEHHSLPSTSAQNGSTEHYSMPSTSERSGQTEQHPVPSIHIQESQCWISDVTERSLCMENLDSIGAMNNASTSHDWQGDMIAEEAVLDAMQRMGSMDRWEMLTVEPESNALHQVESSDGPWLNNALHQVESSDGPWLNNALRQVESSDGPWLNNALHQVESSDGQWLNNASCPPRDWECPRQTWYAENGYDNEEIDGLLEKRPVSNLLASGFRERMDRLLLLHLKKHPEIFGNADDEEFIGNPYQEMGDDRDHVTMQLPLPSNSRPWNQYQDHETSDSDRIAYTSLETPQPFSSDSHNFSPFTNHQSLEMEFLYELKGHVERLQYEMSEIRETLKSCMGMQMMMQNSISQEVAAAVCRSLTAIQGAEVPQVPNTTPKKKMNCCICCTAQVDSLLYRCGHMCTCFKCAHELQWSSSRCPICRAPILDVVRAYPDP